MPIRETPTLNRAFANPSLSPRSSAPACFVVLSRSLAESSLDNAESMAIVGASDGIIRESVRSGMHGARRKEIKAIHAAGRRGANLRIVKVRISLSKFEESSRGGSRLTSRPPEVGQGERAYRALANFFLARERVREEKGREEREDRVSKLPPSRYKSSRILRGRVRR